MNAGYHVIRNSCGWLCSECRTPSHTEWLSLDRPIDEMKKLPQEAACMKLMITLIGGTYLLKDATEDSAKLSKEYISIQKPAHLGS